MLTAKGGGNLIYKAFHINQNITTNLLVQTNLFAVVISTVINCGAE